MNSSAKLFVLSFCTLLFFTECKRGTGDPLISFRTRKNRLTGKWTMTYGKSSRVYGFALTEGIYTEDTYYLRYTSPFSSPFEESGQGKFTLEFERDGKMKCQKNLGRSDAMSMEGTWNFSSGVGKTKNKEQVILRDTRRYTYSFANDIVYSIRELRNKKLVLYREIGEGQNYLKEEFTFEQ